MIGKPEWFCPRKFGWGLGVRKIQGYIYIIIVAIVYGALFALPINQNLRVGAAVVFSAIIIADMLHIMYKVYSKLDEREERHQLVAERNASFTAIAILLVYSLYISMSSALSMAAPDITVLALPIAILLSMSIAKGGTLLLLEREG